MYRDKLQGKIKILGVGFILYSGSLFGQYKVEKPIEVQTPAWDFTAGSLREPILICRPSPFQLKISDNPHAFLDRKLCESKNKRNIEVLPAQTKTRSFKIEAPALLVPSDYYSNQLGIVCRKEWLLEKKTGVPFRFRLGSLHYVDQLEGKIK